MYQDTERVGLPEYTALEALRNNGGDKPFHYSKSSDVFSLGCILFEIWTSNSYVAFPRDLIRTEYLYEFYIDVLKQGRPFTRKNQGSCKLEYDIRNGIQNEKLEDRIKTNMAMSCPDGLAGSFVDLFSQMLIFSWTTRITAENILLSEAFLLLCEKFSTSDTHQLGLIEDLPKNDSDLNVEYSVVEKEKLRSKFTTFYGFSKIFKRRST